MIRPIPLCWAAALVAGASALAITIRNAAHARARLDGALLESNFVRSLAEELAVLRTAQPVGRAPESGLAATVSGALARRGLPPSALASLSPGSGDARGTRQRAVITLASPTLPQVGSFLAAWREAEPDWIVSSIELAPMLGAPVQAGADLPLRAVIGIESSAPITGNGGKT